MVVVMENSISGGVSWCGRVGLGGELPRCGHVDSNGVDDNGQ